MNRIFIPLILVVIIFTGAAYYFINHQALEQPVPLEQGHVCEPDSLVCTDGTILKREGPNCEFPPCPATAPSSPVSSSSSEVTITGRLICLPHINTDGPQTLECALGIAGDDGKNYSLSDPEYKYLTKVSSGSKVEIRGKLLLKSDNKYQSSGTIEIESLTVES